MLEVFQRLKITYTPFKDKINYKINKLNTWLMLCKAIVVLVSFLYI